MIDDQANRCRNCRKKMSFFYSILPVGAGLKLPLSHQALQRLVGYHAGPGSRNNAHRPCTTGNAEE